MVCITGASLVAGARSHLHIAGWHLTPGFGLTRDEDARRGAPLEYPALALVVSGGHTHLFEVRQGFHYVPPIRMDDHLDRTPAYPVPECTAESALRPSPPY